MGFVERWRRWKRNMYKQTRTRVRARRERSSAVKKKKERTEHDLNSVEWGPSQISIFLLSRRSRPNKGTGPGCMGWKEGGKERVEEKGMGNNFTWSNWLRFIIYYLGNNPAARWKRAGNGGPHGWCGKEGKGGGKIPGLGMEGRVEIALARRGGGKSICEWKKRTVGRTYPLIQDLFNYGPSPGLSRGRF